VTSSEPPLTQDIALTPDDAAGIADLFLARHVDLVRLATLLVGDQATAEDVVQDVFTKVCARAGAGPSARPPSAMAHRPAKRDGWTGPQSAPNRTGPQSGTDARAT
jgi:DNA-directed RNA polymerase specialized sigma24 family protein